jgi:hypothetical protein
MNIVKTVMYYCTPNHSIVMPIEENDVVLVKGNPKRGIEEVRKPLIEAILDVRNRDDYNNALRFEISSMLDEQSESGHSKWIQIANLLYV